MVSLLVAKTRVWSGCFWQEQGCSQVASRVRVWSCYLWQKGCGQSASGENKGVVRLLPARTRVRSQCFWGEEQGYGQVAPGENNSVVRLHLVRTGVRTGEIRLLLVKTTVWSGCIW